MYTKEYFRQQLSDIISPIEKYYNGGKVQYARGTKIFRLKLRLLHVRYGDLCRFGQAVLKIKRLKSYI